MFMIVYVHDCISIRLQSYFFSKIDKEKNIVFGVTSHQKPYIYVYIIYLYIYICIYIYTYTYIHNIYIYIWILLSNKFLRCFLRVNVEHLSLGQFLDRKKVFLVFWVVYTPES